MQHLLDNGVRPAHLVTLSTAAKAQQISGKSDSLAELAKDNKVSIYEASNYGLRNKEDLRFFQEESFDLGICTGWQRLIPENILNTFTNGVFGWHGSGFSLPNGRGRSPLNWSLRLGLKVIHHNCFQYDSGADSGKIFETFTFPIGRDDYISDIQLKSLQHILDSSLRLIEKAKAKNLKLTPQLPHPSIYFPTLNEESGRLDRYLLARAEAMQIIKSCSRPFPGSFITADDKQYRIWKAVPVSLTGQFGETILEQTNKLLIKFRDGWISSDDFEITPR